MEFFVCSFKATITLPASLSRSIMELFLIMLIWFRSPPMMLKWNWRMFHLGVLKWIFRMESPVHRTRKEFQMVIWNYFTDASIEAERIELVVICGLDWLFQLLSGISCKHEGTNTQNSKPLMVGTTVQIPPNGLPAGDGDMFFGLTKGK